MDGLEILTFTLRTVHPTVHQILPCAKNALKKMIFSSLCEHGGSRMHIVTALPTSEIEGYVDL